MIFRHQNDVRSPRVTYSRELFLPAEHLHAQPGLLQDQLASRCWTFRRRSTGSRVWSRSSRSAKENSGP